mgnify:CR=1 FL=1|jgi:RimJ/RimL family protein N-acetyltransferase
MAEGAPVRAPYRIETGPVVIRAYEPADVPAVFCMLEDNVEHLGRYMAWIHSRPQSEAELLDLLLEFRGKHDLGQDFTFGIFDRDEGAFVGGCGLHPRCGPGGLEIGYWVAKSHVRRRIATTAAQALTRIGFEHLGAKRMEIHVEPTNLASLAVPPACGYPREGLRRKRLEWLDGALRDSVAFVLVAEDYPTTPSAAADVSLFDASGQPIPLRSSA